ncbi:hypothetical protein BKA61DRAFT_649866 [Leptodontidium sp. MPI-SDFR-AT-0119]|nr:hypothetical protein BKA61DRAFT_649866 [Leptodontidium sp. MPI-SDFR-AT-0119]
MIGTSNSFPVIRAAASFLGLGVITSNVYYPEGESEEWYIEQSNFYRQIRYFTIDISQAAKKTGTNQLLKMKGVEPLDSLTTIPEQPQTWIPEVESASGVGPIGVGLGSLDCRANARNKPISETTFVDNINEDRCFVPKSFTNLYIWCGAA